MNGSTSLHQGHSKLEDSFRQELNDLDFLTDDLTYHSKMLPEIKNRLSLIYEPTSLYTRTRADRVAVHKYYPFVFHFEPKTHDSRKYHDWTIEVYPLALHKTIAMDYGIRCLYIFYNPFTGDEAAFWSNNIPDLSCVMIPDRDVNDVNWYENFCIRTFPNTRIQHIGRVNGSGDPFVIIDQSIVKTLPCGIELVKADLAVFERMERLNNANHRP